MKRLPTDRDILKCIYEMYEDAYPGIPPGEVRGENDPYLPIDVHAVAARLKCEPEMLFGRLYYDLDAKHRYRQDDQTLVPLFYLKLGNKRHCVHFSYLAAILAGQNMDHRRQLLSVGLSLLALALSVAAIVAQIVTAK